MKIAEGNKQFTALVIMGNMEKHSVVYMHRVIKIVSTQQFVNFLNIKTDRNTNAIKYSNSLMLKHAAAYI
jgi:hypothetical protein